MSEELKPCPFCGGDAVRWPSGLVNCKNAECFCSENADFWILVERWNTRTPDTSAVEMVRELLDLAKTTRTKIINWQYRDDLVAKADKWLEGVK